MRWHEEYHDFLKFDQAVKRVCLTQRIDFDGDDEEIMGHLLWWTEKGYVHKRTFW